jgi:hypothetical protein
LCSDPNNSFASSRLVPGGKPNCQIVKATRGGTPVGYAVWTTPSSDPAATEGALVHYQGRERPQSQSSEQLVFVVGNRRDDERFHLGRRRSAHECTYPLTRRCCNFHRKRVKRAEPCGAPPSRLGRATASNSCSSSATGEMTSASILVVAAVHTSKRGAARGVRPVTQLCTSPHSRPVLARPLRSRIAKSSKPLGEELRSANLFVFRSE